jgi:hypothetical protein
MTTVDPEHADNDESWPPAEWVSLTAWTLYRARQHSVLVDDETGQGGWRFAFRGPERITGDMLPILAALLERGALTLGDRQSIDADGEPVTAYELDITPAGRVLHDRLTYQGR